MSFGVFDRDGAVREEPVVVPRTALGGHVHGSGSGATKQDLWRHENGHKKLLNKYGVGAGAQRVYPTGDGGWAGYTNVRSWSRFDKLPIVQQIAVYAAGGIAMGSHSHDYSDDGDIAALLRKVPWSKRRETEAAGRARARKDL